MAHGYSIDDDLHLLTDTDSHQGFQRDDNQYLAQMQEMVMYEFIQT